MGIFTSRAAEQLFIQPSQPTGQQAGAIWVNGGTTPRPELRIFDGSDWNQEDPVGSIMPFGGAVATIPSGWLLCNDQAVSRTTFANLFDAIGTFYGIGDGSTTFNVPDLRAKFPRGAADAQNPGSEGGEDTHALTTAELASHSHSFTAPQTATSTTGGGGPDRDIINATKTNGTNTVSAVSHTGAIANAGSGTAHENKPAFQEVIYIIKT